MTAPANSSTPARRFDFIALGRAAVDLYGEQIGGRLEDMASFAKYVGGCPANISIGAARLGLKPAMLTRVGDEHMGRFVRETLAAEGVDVGQVRTDPARLTALVILGIRDRHNFPHIFYRENCADMGVVAEDVDADVIASATALLVTGTHFSTESVDRASRTAMRYAQAAGTKIVFDIDYRPVLWGLAGHGGGEQRFVVAAHVSRHLGSIAAACDLVVGTEEEFHIAGGSTDTLAALRNLRAVSRAVFVLKRGADGCIVFEAEIPPRLEDGLVMPGYPVEVFNVLGAGDGFMAGLLRGWLRGEDWRRACSFANGCGALVVARHGCAPAMPSWRELEDFLGRADRPRELHRDARTTELHRVSTGRRQWPEITALAFDHRQQFETLAARVGAPHERISAFKQLIAQAVLAESRGLDGAGAIVDDRFGRDALDTLSGAPLWIARPVEKPGASPLEFEHGAAPHATLRAWPQHHTVKCLVAYHPDAAAESRAADEERLRLLQSACRATGHDLLVEVIPPHLESLHTREILPRALSRLYDAGIRPDWWKLPPSDSPAAWRRIGQIVRANDADCRGLLVLGLDSTEQDLQQAFMAAAAEPLVRGFAVGRLIFWQTAEAWFAGQLDDAAAVAQIARQYRRVLGLWRARHDERASA